MAVEGLTPTRWPVAIGLTVCVAGLAACGGRGAVPTSAITTRDTGVQQLVFLTREGCAASAAMRTNLDAALQSLAAPANYAVIDLASLPDRDPRSGYPTPTVLNANRDIFGMPEPPVPHPPAT